MARVRSLSVDNLFGVLTPSAGVSAESVVSIYENALVAADLTGPVSGVRLGLVRPKTPTPDECTVLVYCDRPTGFEVLTAPLGMAVSRLSDEQTSRLVVDVLHVGLDRLAIARDWPRSVLAEVARNAERGLPVEVSKATHPYRVTASGRGVTAPEQPHEIRDLGGGPMNDVPKLYDDELTRLLTEVTGPDWAHWWSHSPVKTAEIHTCFDVTEHRVRVRVGKRVTVTIERPVSTLNATADLVAMARRDVADVVARLTARLGLPEPPTLTDRPRNPDHDRRLTGLWGSGQDLSHFRV